MTAFPRPTHLVHVVGKAIVSETKILASPVVADGIADRAAFEAVMLATVRRCMSHRADLDLEVDWAGDRRATVWVHTILRAEPVARFRITDITPDDVARVGAAIPKEFIP